MTSLLDLGISHNRLTSLPSEIGVITALRSLRVNFNNLVELPASLGDLWSLQSRILSDNDLIALPLEIGLLSVITELNIENNPNLKVPPVEIIEKGIAVLLEYCRRVMTGRLTGTLHLKDLSLRSIPKEVLDSTSLTSLVLDNNSIHEIPNELGDMLSLTEFSISGNKLTYLPPSMGQLVNMQRLVFDKSNMKSPPDEVIAGGTPAVMRYLRRINSAKDSKTLNFDQFNLRLLPPDISRLGPYLHDLSASHNHLPSVPPGYLL